jgi:hypothetical protein
MIWEWRTILTKKKMRFEGVWGVWMDTRIRLETTKRESYLILEVTWLEIRYYLGQKASKFSSEDI